VLVLVFWRRQEVGTVAEKKYQEKCQIEKGYGGGELRGSFYDDGSTG